MKIYKSMIELIGHTPLLEIECGIYAKLEFFNPMHSVKDRAALAMIEAAEQSGKLASGGTLIEATSGNTGIGLAYIAAIKGYKLILTMPESMSIERRSLLSALGATLVLTNAKLGMRGANTEAEQLHKHTPNSIIVGQFSNPANPKIHYDTTAREIFDDMDGNVDVFVSGVGTGGTFSGVSKYLKEKNPNIYTVAVEPFESQVLAGGNSNSHIIQGIGANFTPDNFDRSLANEILPITGDDAAAASNMLTKQKGIFVGISGGAAYVAATKLKERHEFTSKNIVCIFPDSGEKYISTGIFNS